jgi:hypothetical protein
MVIDELLSRDRTAAGSASGRRWLSEIWCLRGQLRSSINYQSATRRPGSGSPCARPVEVEQRLDAMSSCSRRHRPPDCQPSAWISTRRSFVRRSFTAGLLCGWRRGDGVQPWVLLQPDQEVRTELDRWFLTVAGSVDAITAGVLLALARRLRRTLLVLELAGAVIVGRRHHPSLPANIRCHPRNRRGAADRLSVLA